MAAAIDIKALLIALQFSLEEGVSGAWIKKYPQHDGYLLRVSIDDEEINYGDKVKLGGKTTCNFKDNENFVVLECVDRLLTKGYKPQDITLEKTFPSGHGHSGRLDIFVEKEGKAFLMIECKTFGKEFEKEFQNIKKNGGQLFTYFQNDRSAEILMLYASELNSKKHVVYCNEIVVIEEDYKQTTNVKDFYDRWNKLTKNNGVFDQWVMPYGFQSKALTLKNLKEITQADSGFIFNQFLEILRHNVVSDKPNAFNKIFTLFLCKIYDEKAAKPNDELAFQWFYSPYQYEGISYPPDDHISFQKRLTDLYKKGMNAFLDKSVTDISDAEFEKKYGKLDGEVKKQILNEFTEIRLKKNNEFAIKEVFNDDSFNENAKVVKEVVELLQGYKIRYTKKQQYLSDFFELLLTTGLKQESGQFFTPVPIAQFIIKSLPLDTLVAKKLQEGKAEEENLLPTVIDYAAGSGHFITESMHELQRLIDKTNPDDFIEGTAKKIKTWQNDHFEWAYKYVYGVEKDYRLVKVGKVGCYLHGDGLAQIIHSDGLANFSNCTDYKGLLTKVDKDFPKENKQFDIVVSNPPYSVSAFKNNARKYYNENDFDIYNKLTDQSSEIECLFIERTKQLLKDGGIAGIILPSSILSNAGIYTKAREIILCYFEIIAIAELGSNTFMATGTNTVTLFLRRRNNYDFANIKVAVERFITNLQDVTINSIEKPVTKYVAHVWEGVNYTDYLTLLQRKPNKTIAAHEIYQDYAKKINAKNEQEKWDAIVTLEQEKLLYFILAYPQQVVLVKTGEKNEEKAFLGYEFSNRRGSEGIHPIQRGKHIDDCTRLFDPEIFDNREKASTYIYQAFQGIYSEPIPESLQQNITRHRLVDMLTFDRVDFEKNVSLVVKKKVRFEDIWGVTDLAFLGDLANIKKGTSITKDKTIDGNIPVIAGGQEAAYYHNQSNREGNIVTVSASGAYAGFVSYFETPIFASDCNTIQSKNEVVISTKILFLFLKVIQSTIYELQRGQAQPHVYGDDLAKIKIPLPPKDIQEKILTEIEALELKEAELVKQSEAYRNDISSLMLDIPLAQMEKLENVALMLKRGKSAKYGNSSVQIIKSGQARGFKKFDFNTKHFVDESFVLDERQLQKGDILINSSGVGTAGRVTLFELDGTFVVDSHVTILRPNTQIVLPDFVLQSLAAIGFKNIEAMAMGQSGQIELTITTIQNIKIPLPSIEVQQEIVSKINAIELEITALEKAIAAIPQQKEAVLKKYL